MLSRKRKKILHSIHLLQSSELPWKMLCPRCGFNIISGNIDGWPQLSRCAEIGVRVCHVCHNQELYEETKLIPKTPLKQWAVFNNNKRTTKEPKGEHK